MQYRPPLEPVQRWSEAHGQSVALALSVVLILPLCRQSQGGVGSLSAQSPRYLARLATSAAAYAERSAADCSLA